MALAQRASPPRSDGTAQGAEHARAGYMWRLSDPPPSSGARPIAYDGGYGEFSRPSPGDPLRGEALAYLGSWAARLSAAAGALADSSTPLPQPVWGGVGSLSWMRGAFPRLYQDDPGLCCTFRLRLLDFMRLRRVPVACECDRRRPPSRAWLTGWYCNAPELRSGEAYRFSSDPQADPPTAARPPTFRAGYSLASTQAELDGNGGRWLVPVPEGGEDSPFPAGKDTPNARRVLEYLASLSDGQDPDLNVRQCGFASGLPMLGVLRPFGHVPDPSPEPLRASDVRALFADALGSGRSRVLADCESLGVFAELGELVDVPAETETRWVYSVRVQYVWNGAAGVAAFDTGELDPGPDDFGAVDPASVARRGWTAYDQAGGKVVLDYSYNSSADKSTWTAAYFPPGSSVVSPQVPLTAVYDGPNLASLASGACVNAAYPGSYCAFTVSREPYDHEVRPAYKRRRDGTAAMEGAGFDFWSEARLEPAVQTAPDAPDELIEGWAEDNIGIGTPDGNVHMYFGGPNGVYAVDLQGSDPDDNLYDPEAAYYACNPQHPTPPYTGNVQWANAVGQVRGSAASVLVADAGLLPSGWSPGGGDWIVGSSESDWLPCRNGINYMDRSVAGPDGTSFESVRWEPPRFVEDLFDLEYMQRAPWSGGGPLCAGGVSVPLRSADSVAVLPLFCATVTVETDSELCMSERHTHHTRPGDWWGGWDVVYTRISFSHVAVREERTYFVVGFADRPCSWTRDAGEGYAPASARRPFAGASGPAGMWALVESAVLPLAGAAGGAAALVRGAPGYETYMHAMKGDDPAPDDSGDIVCPHDAVTVTWSEGGEPHVVCLQEMSVARDSDAVVHARVHGTVEFPLCVYESGYCA